jgi:hopanoid C-3 methylase
MRVLLIEPPVSPFDVPTGTFSVPPPHHLERLAGALRGHHDVRIIDLRLEAGLASEVSAFQPDLVGISCVAANSRLAKDVLRQVKALKPGTVTVMGGHHPSLYPHDCADPNVDVVVVGEGELTLLELAAAVERGAPFGSVAGVGYMESGRFRLAPPRELADLDALPLPDRRLTEKYRRNQRYYRAGWRPVDLCITSRGCPFRCKFCGLWKINQGRFRHRQPERVADELGEIGEPYVCFVDDNTLDNVASANRLADLVRERGIRKTFELYGRADTVVRHPELVEKWRGVGMKLLLIGLEACDQASLDSMNKRLSVDTNRQALEICHANDVEVVAYFIVDPGFSRDDFRRLGDYVEQHKLTHPVFTILSPFPGTELYEEVKASLITGSFELIDFYHTVMPTRLPLRDFYDEFTGLYRRAYSLRHFVTAIREGKAMLSPGMIVNNYRARRRMAALYRHHGVVARREDAERRRGHGERSA